MKQYLIFIISLLLLFAVFQMLSGWIMTLAYTPDISDAWYQSENLSHEVTFNGNGSIIPTIISTGLAGTIAFLVVKKIKNI
ncbi:hypothetical protein [Tuberibacillus sp. Marseille-P3662]|uniref:hypothetical protein n=1 Tax=Tuberibacillus sp. Marseille-P3662 TaxID=1965358 RepID=UPI000A1CF17D|nr:hypothetical protein [Tuberibacillus sp. Marseille-P3662]